MNNRIMAMLMALVAAMFISIAPVKAEAVGDHTCYDNNNTYICDVEGCGKHVHQRDLSKDVAANPATCAEAGNEAYFVCGGCDAISKFKDFRSTTTQEAVTIDKLTTHTPGAPYTNQGRDQHSYECTVCKGKIFENHTFGADCTCVCGAVSHQLTKQGTDKAATCYEKGSVSFYKCGRCGGCFTDETATKVLGNSVLPMVDHSFSDTVWTSNENHHWHVCTNEGCTQVQANSQQAHTFVAKDNGDGKHVRECSVCGYKQSYIGEHDLEYTPVDKDKHIVSCKICDYEATVDHEDDNGNCYCDKCSKALEHQYGDWTPIVNTNGSSDSHHKECTAENCHVTTAPEAHKYQVTKSTDGVVHTLTCIDCGRSTTQTCTDNTGDCLCDNKDCGALIKHSAAMMDTKTAKAATCTEDGYAAHYQCRTCEGVFTLNCEPTTADAVKKAKLGHEGDGYWRVDTTKGTHYQACKRHAACKTIVTDATGKTEGAAQHTYSGEWKPLINANGSSNEHYRLCDICGHEDSAAKEKHTYEASKSTDGVTHKLKCTVCGKETRQNCSDANGDCLCDVEGCGVLRKHVITESTMRTVKAQAAGCLTEGWEEHFRCEKCENLFNRAGEKIEKPVIEPLNHKLAEKDVSNTDDYHLYQCVNPGCTESVIVPHHDDNPKDCLCDEDGCGKLLHDHTVMHMPKVDPDCINAGTEAYFYYADPDCDRIFKYNADGSMGAEISAPIEIPATNHANVSDWTPGEDGKHIKTCLDCGEVMEEKEHNFASGSVCPDCGANEKLTPVAAKSATCYNTGNTAYWLAVNGDKYADPDGVTKLEPGEEVTAKREHKLVWKAMADGKRHEQVCLYEDCTYQPVIENHVVGEGCYCSVCYSAIAGHERKFHAMERATCAEVGHEAYYECEACDKLYDMAGNVITAPKTIAKVDHDFVGAKMQIDSGKHYVKCNKCSYRLYENHAKVLEDPKKGNYHQWLCECGEVEIEPHIDNNGDKVCDVCGNNSAGKTVTVEQHDNVTVKTGEKETVNPIKTWWENWQNQLTGSNSGGTASTVVTPNSNTSSAPESGSQSSGNGSQAPESGSQTPETQAPETQTPGVGGSAPVVSTPDATAPSGIMQFISWILGLFGL